MSPWRSYPVDRSLGVRRPVVASSLGKDFRSLSGSVPAERFPKSPNCAAFTSMQEVPHLTTTGPDIRVVENATCTFCGCVCDDMILTVEGQRITKAKNACVLGNAWFLNHHAEDRPV